MTKFAWPKLGMGIMCTSVVITTVYDKW